MGCVVGRAASVGRGSGVVVAGASVCGGLVEREGRVALSVFLLIPVGEEW